MKVETPDDIIYAAQGYSPANRDLDRQLRQMTVDAMDTGLPEFSKLMDILLGSQARATAIMVMYLNDTEGPAMARNFLSHGEKGLRPQVIDIVNEHYANEGTVSPFDRNAEIRHEIRKEFGI